MYKKLITFDFDDTLFDTPGPHEGKLEWKRKTGGDWIYGGWWGKSESIDPDIFYIHLNEWVYNEYLKAVSDPENYVILATGRLAKVPNMRKNIDKILNQNNISFDEVYLNWGGDTFHFKTKLFEELSIKLKVDTIIMYDDRHEHLIKFREWSKTQDIEINIVDINNKKIYKNI